MLDPAYAPETAVSTDSSTLEAAVAPAESPPVGPPTVPHPRNYTCSEFRGTDSGGSRPDLPRRTDSAHRMGCAVRDARYEATAQVECPRGVGGGKLSGAAAQMVPINRGPFRCRATSKSQPRGCSQFMV